MRPELKAVAAHNGGPFTRQDAARCGYTERELKTLTGDRGAWVVLRRGVYVDRAWFNAHDDDGRYALRVRATLLSSTVSGAASHTSAAALLELPLRPRWREQVHVTRPGVRGGRGEAGVKHHRSALAPSSVVEVAGLRVTRLARTGLDIARELGFEDGVVALDAALRKGATRRELADELTSMWCWPGITSSRAAARFADPRAESVGESLLRVLVAELDLGEIEPQHCVSDGVRTAYADLRVGRHLFEFDGRIKYVDRRRGGIADKPAEQIVWEEKQREDWIRRTNGGYGVSRVIWSEMLGTQRRRTQQRLLAEYAATVRRFGDAAA